MSALMLDISHTGRLAGDRAGGELGCREHSLVRKDHGIDTAIVDTIDIYSFFILTTQLIPI